MTKLLYIAASPRGSDSKSNALAQSFVDARRLKNPGLTVDALDLWHETLPEFDGARAAAKMTFFGVGEMNGNTQVVWDEIVRITQRFIGADEYVFSVPMWNGGVPYRLKQYIDIITQPGLLFGFDPDAGYNGLLKNKKATVVYTSGVYRTGADTKYGRDFHSSYLNWWLDFIGVSDIETIRFQPSLLSENPQRGFDDALARTIALASGAASNSASTGTTAEAA